MSDFRYDPVKRSWVILAARRGERPSHYRADTSLYAEPKNCPFCPGNEAMTPPEVYSQRPDDSAPDIPGWSIRVVPNKFPALTMDEVLADGLLKYQQGGIHNSIPGFGGHEIIIETPVKNHQMVDMDQAEIAEILTVYRERMCSYLSDKRFKSVIIFKNHGREAGASLVHSHSQLMALPVIPEHVASHLDSFQAYRERTARCLMCDILAKEIEDRTRVIMDDDGFLVLAPFAASSPFQLSIVPKEHSHDLSLSGDDTLGSLALVLGNTLRRLRGVLGEHPWNMVLHNAPANLDEDTDVAAYHWFLEITPRLTHMAGFEMGSGMFINTVAPEECAEILRECRM